MGGAVFIHVVHTKQIFCIMENKKHPGEEHDYKDANDKSTEMNTLTAVYAKAVKNGFKENFRMSNTGLLSSADVCYRPEQVTFTNFYRFEGDSDPADNTILYLVTCEDGLKGTLVDAYGTYANPVVTKFMEEVETTKKQ